VKSNHVDEHATCGFCDSKLKENSTLCPYCGAEIIMAYIDRPTRKLILYLRIILIFISALLILLLYQNYNFVNLSVILAIPLFLLAWVMPWLFFRIKNRDNYIWRKKNPLI
jgi:hypothetical protein